MQIYFCQPCLILILGINKKESPLSVNVSVLDIKLPQLIGSRNNVISLNKTSLVSSLNSPFFQKKSVLSANPINFLSVDVKSMISHQIMPQLIHATPIRIFRLLPVTAKC